MDAAAPPPPPTNDAQAKALVSKFCSDCHNDTKTKGKLNLQPLLHDPIRSEYAKPWREGAARVSQSEMPPEDSAQPTNEERATIVRWMQGNLNAVVAKQPPSAGRVTARRLNRLEYRNTIRDLLHIELSPLTFDPTRDFPADGAGYGFDNIGDVLSLSSLHLEQYLSAAGQVLDEAIVVEGLDGPKTWRFEGKDMRVSAIGKAGDLATPKTSITPRGWYAEIDVRQPGEYLFRAEIVSEQSNRKQAQMAFLVDGKDPEKFTLTREAKPSKIERKVKLRTKGLQQAAVAYLYEQGKPEFKPEDGEAGGFSVTSLEVVGPLGLSPETAPASHRQIFVSRPSAGVSRRQAAEQTLTKFAARAFRRPVTATEVDRLLKLFEAADVEGETFEGAVKAPLLAVLVSPHFLFRVEADRPSFAPGSDYALNSFEIASRLSYFLWSTMPDEALIQAAEQGALLQPAELEKQVRRMLLDPKASMLSEAFATQWLQIRGIETLPPPDPKKFGKLGTALKDAMRAEPVLLFQHVLREDRPITDLVAADYTFLNEELAKLYKIDGIKGKEMRLVKLNDPRRGGVLTTAGVLAVTSHPDRTSPVKRGKWVLDAILGAPPPPPPPDVGELPAEVATTNGRKQQQSLRERLEIHRSQASCAACHKRMDPLGFALENFDAVGRWRDKDGSLPVDASAELPDGRKAAGPVDLKTLLVAERDALATCLSEKLLTFALGRGLEESDRPTVEAIAKATAADDYKLSRIVIEISKSYPFRNRQSVAK